MISTVRVLAVLHDLRFSKFRIKSQLSDAEALGCLLMFWAAGCQLRMTEATLEQAKGWLPVTTQSEDCVFSALIAAGYVSYAGGSLYLVIDNVRAIKEHDRRAAIGSVGGKKSAARRANMAKPPL